MPTNTHTPATMDDPGKNVGRLATDQAVNLVKTISAKSIVELTDMRDHIDTLMRAISEREYVLITDIENHTDLAVSVINMKSIVRDNLEQLIARVQPVAATVTHRKNGQ